MDVLIYLQRPTAQEVCLALKMKALRFFDMLGTIYLMIQRTIPENFNNNNIIIIIVIVIVCIPKPSRWLSLTQFLMFERKCIFRLIYLSRQ